MNTTVPFSIPEDARDLLTNLRISDEETRGQPLMPPGQGGLARRWLARVLSDCRALQAHVALLEEFYRVKPDYPGLSRRVMEGRPLFRVEAAQAFRHNQLLPQETVQAIAERGPDVLADPELARLLLNPLALWDVADLIDYLLPEYWLGQRDAIGLEIMGQEGLKVPVPGDDDGLEDAEEVEELALPGVRGEANPGRHDGGEWELSFKDGAARAIARRIAEHAYGDPAQSFTLTLRRLPVPESEGLVRAQVGMSPAPTKEDFVLTVVFPVCGERTFTLEVPPEAKMGKRREWTRSEPCDPLPAAAFDESKNHVEWHDSVWPPVVAV